MACLYRPFARTTIDVTPRMAASSSVRCSTSTLMPTAIPPQECDVLTVPKIYDIFDAPARLRGSRACSGQSKSITHPSSAQAMVHHSAAKSIYSKSMGLPWTLPPPIIFDGPARPVHMSPSALEKRRRWRQNVRQSSRRGSESSTVSSKALTSPSEPLYEVFDGPSRIARYKYPLSPPASMFRPHTLTILLIASAYSWLVYQDQVDSYQRSERGSAKDSCGYMWFH